MTKKYHYLLKVDTFQIKKKNTSPTAVYVLYPVTICTPSTPVEPLYSGYSFL